MIKVGDIIYMSGYYVVEKIEPLIVTEENKLWWCNRGKNIGDKTVEIVTYRQIATKTGAKRVKKSTNFATVDINTWNPTMAQDHINKKIASLNQILEHKI